MYRAAKSLSSALVVLAIAAIAALPAAADMGVGEAPAGQPGGALWELYADSGGSLHISDYQTPAIISVDTANAQRKTFTFDLLDPTYVIQPLDAKPRTDGALWWSDYLGAFGSVNRTSGAVAYWDLLSFYGLVPSGFALDSSARLWFYQTAAGTGELVRFTPGENEICLYVVGGAGNYVTFAGGMLWLPDKDGRILRFNIATGELTEWLLPLFASPASLALDPQGGVWWADTVLGQVGRLMPDTAEVTEYELPDGSEPVMLAAGTEAMWFSDVGSVVGFVEPAAAAGSVTTLPTVESQSPPTCFYLDEAPAAQTASQAVSPVNYAAATWVAAPSIAGVTRYGLPAAGDIAARPYGITISGGRTWVVDQDRLALSRLPRLPQAPKPAVRLVSGGVEVSWQAVNQDEGGGATQVSAYRVWRSDAPYFSAWDAGLTLASDTTATSAIDPVTLSPDSPLFYAVRSVAATGLLSATSAEVGAFSYGLVKGAAQ